MYCHDITCVYFRAFKVTPYVLSVIMPFRNPVYWVRFKHVKPFKHVKSAYGFQIKAYLHKGRRMGGCDTEWPPHSKVQTTGQM